jgi:hypothetical protein
MTTSSLIAAYIPGYGGHVGGPNGEIIRVVVHGTVSATIRGGARNNARYFQSPGSGGLAHYTVDADEIIGCADEDMWTWGAPPNPGEIHVEFCDIVDGPPERWADLDHQSMLHLGARLIGDICARRHVPLVQLSTGLLILNRHGITGHLEVSEAWHQTDHHDPGPGFPWAQLSALITGPTPAPVRLPPPAAVIHTYTGDPDMANRIDMTINTDSLGNGWGDLPAVAFAKVGALMPNGADPATAGYVPTPRLSALGIGAGTRVVVEGGPPNGAMGVHVLVTT